MIEEEANEEVIEEEVMEGEKVEVEKVDDVKEEAMKQEEEVEKEEEEDEVNKVEEVDVKKEEVVVGEEENKEELFAEDFKGDAVEVVEGASVKRTRAPLTVTKATILAAIDHGDVAYIRANQLTKKGTINTLFANTRATFATAEKDSAGKKRVVSVTTLARAIYRFVAAPTEEAAIIHYAIIEVLLKQCDVKASDETGCFLTYIMADAWKMARKTPEVPNDPSCHSPLKRRWLLARLLLAADATWLAEKGLVVEALMTFIICRKAEFCSPLLEDKTRMAILDENDKVQLRAYAVDMGSELAVQLVNKAFFASPLPALAGLSLACGWYKTTVWNKEE